MPILGGLLASIGSLLRLPALATFIAGLFAQLISWIAGFVGRRAALATGVIASLTALAVTMTVTINAIASELQYLVPPELAQGFAMFVPDNAVPCLTAVASCRLVRWAWEWQFYAVDKVSS